MRQFRFLALLISAAFLVTSCAKKPSMIEGFFENPEIDNIQIMVSDDGDDWPSEGICGVQVFGLIAGQDIPVGTVTVASTALGEVFVKYEISGDCPLIETHLFIGDISKLPVGNNGNPKIGHFPFAWEDSQGSDVVIHKIELDEGVTSFDIVAHAVVLCGEEEETAFAKRGEIVISLKALTCNSYMVTGDGGPWCSMDHVSLNTALSQTIDLEFFHNDPDLGVIGSLDTEIVGDDIVFTIKSIYEDCAVNQSYLFVGSLEALNVHGICNYRTYPNSLVKDLPEHVYTFPASIFLGGDEELIFGGSRWGWYIPGYTIGGC